MTDSPSRGEFASLSTDGSARKRRMLDELTTEMARVHRARRGRRMISAIGLAVVGLVAVGLWRGWPAQAPGELPSNPIFVHGPNIEAESGSSPDAPSQLAGSVPVTIITMIRTTDDVMDACRVRTSPAAMDAARISDVELLNSLTAINRPAGLVRSGGKVWLTREVTDGSL